MLLSVCMIVKNEEKVIERCLNSIVNDVDEIIIVDTGSSDNTKELARKYTNHIYDYKWDNHFANARNFSISKASGKWILVLDADEFIQGNELSKLRHFLEQEANSSYYEIEIISFMDKGGLLKNMHSRLFLNNGTVKYERAIHEILISSTEERIQTAPFSVYHSGYLTETVKEKNKSERNIELLKNRLDSEEVEAIDYFFIANEYKILGDEKKALHYYQLAYKGKKTLGDGFIPQTIYSIYQCLNALDQKDSAKEIIFEAATVYSRLADFKILKAELLFKEGLLEEVYNIANTVIKSRAELRTTVDYGSITYKPHYLLAQVYSEKQKKFSNLAQLRDLNAQQSFEQYNLAFAYLPDRYELLRPIVCLLNQYETVENIETFISDKFDLTNQESLKLLLSVLFTFSANDTVSTFIPTLIEKLNSNLMRQVYGLKYMLLLGNLTGIHEEISVLSEEALIKLLNLKIFDLQDLMIYMLMTNDYSKLETLKSHLNDTKMRQSLEYLLGDRSLKGSIKDKNLYCSLFERVIAYQKFELVDYLFEHITAFHPSVYETMGDLFWYYGYCDLARDLYGQAKYGALSGLQLSRLG